MESIYPAPNIAISRPANPVPHRPTLLTPEIRDRIVMYARAGTYSAVAAQACGICKDTYFKWQRRGLLAAQRHLADEPIPDSELPYLDFFYRLREAKAQVEAEDIALIRKAGSQDWKARAWYQERVNRERWGVARPETGYIALQDAERLLGGLVQVAQEMRDAAEAHTDPVVQAALCEQVRDYVARITDLAQELAERMPGRLDEPAE